MMEYSNDQTISDEYRLWMNRLTNWLDKHDIAYDVSGRWPYGDGDPRYVYVRFNDGRYIRISDFDTPVWYVRDTGWCAYMNPFDIIDEILERHEKELEEE